MTNEKSENGDKRGQRRKCKKPTRVHVESKLKTGKEHVQRSKNVYHNNEIRQKLKPKLKKKAVYKNEKVCKQKYDNTVKNTFLGKGKPNLEKSQCVPDGYLSVGVLHHSENEKPFRKRKQSQLRIMTTNKSEKLLKKWKQPERIHNDLGITIHRSEENSNETIRVDKLFHSQTYDELHEIKNEKDHTIKKQVQKTSPLLPEAEDELLTQLPPSSWSGDNSIAKSSYVIDNKPFHLKKPLKIEPCTEDLPGFKSDTSVMHQRKRKGRGINKGQYKRRLIANARERNRVHTLGRAFEDLRSAIPSFSDDQKLSKLTILKLAISYISALDNLLHYNESSQARLLFAANVDECTSALQTEYGRAKRKYKGDTNCGQY